MTHSEQIRNSSVDSLERATKLVRVVSDALADGSITKAELPALKAWHSFLALATEDAGLAIQRIEAGLDEREDMDAARWFEVGR